MQVIYSDIEHEIMERLSPMTTGGGVSVVILPQVQEEFQLPMQAGRVTVAYKSSDFGDVRSTHQISQDEKIQFEIIFEARFLRGDVGIHKMVEAVKRLLVGYQPTDCSKMYVVRNGFVERNNETALWTYSMLFETKYLLVEDFEFNEPPLQEITFIYNIEDEHSVSPPLSPTNVTIYNSENTILSTQPPGGAYLVPNAVIDIKFNGALIERVEVPAGKDETISITN